MSRLGWLRTAEPRRTAVAAALFVGAFVLPFAIVFAAAEDARMAVLMSAAAQSGLLAGVIAGLRPAPPVAGRRPRLGRALVAVGLVTGGVWLGTALSLLGGFAVAGVVAFTSGTTLPDLAGSAPGVDAWWPAIIAATTGTAAAAAALTSFGITRGLMLLWRRWDRQRRAKLRWALTHSLLVTSLFVAIVIGLVLLAFAIPNSAMPSSTGILRPDASGVERFLATVVIVYLPMLFALILIPLVIAVVIVPPVALIAFPVLSRATRRIEALAAATSAVRAGDLGARTEVSGEDEIARLQADFNAMAADLERNVAELRDERDAVGRLLQDRRELVAAVSHELRTPLATLRGYLDSALEHGDEQLSAPLRQDLKTMSSEAERLHHLIDDLFTLSRTEIGRLPFTTQPTALAPLLEGVVTTAAPLAWRRGRVELVAHLPDDLPPVLADAARFEQIARNLITNAVRHTPPGGLVLVSAEPADGRVAVHVRDTGEGIAAADLPLIWDRFYRAGASHDRAGAGLGLALVKELTEAMGGTVAVESTPGAGSCFTICLPAAPVPTAHPVAHSTAP
jgi:signal transduction histidine kinase